MPVRSSARTQPRLRPCYSELRRPRRPQSWRGRRLPLPQRRLLTRARRARGARSPPSVLAVVRLAGLVLGADDLERLVELDVDLVAVVEGDLDLVHALLVADLGAGDLAAACVIESGLGSAVVCVAGDGTLVLRVVATGGHGGPDAGADDGDAGRSCGCELGSALHRCSSRSGWPLTSCARPAESRLNSAGLPGAGLVPRQPHGE